MQGALVSHTDDLIMGLTEQECRAALLILASPTQDRDTAARTAEVIGYVRATTRS